MGCIYIYYLKDLEEFVRFLGVCSFFGSCIFEVCVVCHKLHCLLLCIGFCLDFVWGFLYWMFGWLLGMFVWFLFVRSLWISCASGLFLFL